MLSGLEGPERDRIIAQQSFHPFTPQTLTSPQALQADLETCRSRGFAFDNEEHEPGIICVAMPIQSGSGRVMGGLSVTSTTARHDLEGLAKLIPDISGAVKRIAEDAETWHFPDEMRQPA